MKAGYAGSAVGAPAYAAQHLVVEGKSGDAAVEGDDGDLFPRDAFGTGEKRNSRRGSEIISSEALPSLPNQMELRIQTDSAAPAVAAEDVDASDSESLGSDEDAVGGTAGASASSKALSPSGVRRNSQQCFADKMHTTLLLDWDDTIFPTTWVKKDCEMCWKLRIDDQLERGSLRKQQIVELLEKHLEKADAFFHEANSYANIFIVTLARRPWVEMSMENFLPGLKRFVSKYKIIYAMDFVDGAAILKDEPPSSEKARNFWIRAKCEAIKRELDDYHKRNGASWKNIISLGDSDFERFGTIVAAEEYMKRELEGSTLVAENSTLEGVSKDGHFKRLRTKTVKMLIEPTIEELTAQLALLTRWLPHIVKQDSGFDIVLDTTEDNNQLRHLHKKVTGEDATFTWEELAGLEPQPAKE